MAWVFCTKSDVMDILPITEDELQDSWSDMVEGFIMEYLGKPALGTYEVITDEYHSGDGTSILKVRKPPIDSVTSISVNDGVLTASEYVVFLNTVQLKYGQVFPLGTLNIKITYTAGSFDISPRVRLAAVTMIAAMANYRRRAGADGKLKWANSETKMGSQQPVSDIGLVKHMRDIMKTVLRRDRPRIG